MTMRELAKLCYVSVSTVSKAFNGSDEISEETRQHVFAVAKEQGCFGQFCKDKHPKKIIAVLCPEVGSDYYASHLEQLRTLIEQAGGICLISSYQFDHDKQEELIEYYTHYLKVDGLLVFDLHRPLDKNCPIPAVAMFSSVDPLVDTVSCPLSTAIQEAVDTLVTYGHRQIAFIGEPLTQSKACSFEDAMRRHPLCSPITVESPLRFEEAGADGVERLLRQTDGVTAVICGYDNIAMGAIKQLRQRGYRVPEDVSVVGMDNNAAGQYAETTLSSIDSRPEEMCRTAWELLQRKIDNRYYKAKHKTVLEARLIVRESIGPAKRQA